MFKIYDGRQEFYQWDIDRKLIVDDPTITQVHFCNRTDDCSLVCETYVENGLTLVNVPNVLLQTDWRIRAYAYDSFYTKFEKWFEVNARTKPTDYVYTETETLNYNSLLEKMVNIEENIGEAVSDYLEENDITVDLTGYATEEYVDAAIKDIELTPGAKGDPGYTPIKGIDYDDGEKGDKGDPGYTPVKGVDYFDGDPGVYVSTTEPVSDDALIWINPEGDPNDDIATKKYVDEAIAAASIGGGSETDLSNYYTKAEVNALIPSTTGFITMADVKALGYQTETQVNTLINTALGVIENGTY